MRLRNRFRGPAKIWANNSLVYHDRPNREPANPGVNAILSASLINILDQNASLPVLALTSDIRRAYYR